LSVNSESTPPRGYVPIDTAGQILTDGGTVRALTFAATFLRLVVDNQGAPGTAVPKLKWWPRDRGEPLHVNMRDIPGLRGEFGRLLADHLSADEWGPPSGVTSTTRRKTTGVGRLEAALKNLKGQGVDIINMSEKELHKLALANIVPAAGRSGHGERNFKRARANITNSEATETAEVDAI
jgi:hypothetical protein